MFRLILSRLLTGTGVPAFATRAIAPYYSAHKIGLNGGGDGSASASPSVPDVRVDGGLDSRLRGNDDLWGLRRLRRDCPAPIPAFASVGCYPPPEGDGILKRRVAWPSLRKGTCADKNPDFPLISDHFRRLRGARDQAVPGIFRSRLFSQEPLAVQGKRVVMMPLIPGRLSSSMHRWRYFSKAI